MKTTKLLDILKNKGQLQTPIGILNLIGLIWLEGSFNCIFMKDGKQVEFPEGKISEFTFEDLMITEENLATVEEKIESLRSSLNYLHEHYRDRRQSMDSARELRKDKEKLAVEIKVLQRNVNDYKLGCDSFEAISSFVATHGILDDFDKKLIAEDEKLSWSERDSPSQSFEKMRQHAREMAETHKCFYWDGETYYIKNDLNLIPKLDNDILKILSTVYKRDK